MLARRGQLIRRRGEVVGAFLLPPFDESGLIASVTRPRAEPLKQSQVAELHESVDQLSVPGDDVNGTKPFAHFERVE